MCDSMNIWFSTIWCLSICLRFFQGEIIYYNKKFIFYLFDFSFSSCSPLLVYSPLKCFIHFRIPPSFLPVSFVLMFLCLMHVLFSHLQAISFVLWSDNNVLSLLSPSFAYNRQGKCVHSFDMAPYIDKNKRRGKRKTNT